MQMISNMNSDNKSLISSSLAQSKSSLLSEDILRIIDGIVTYGCEGGTLNLETKGIDDTMIPELCESLAKIQSKIRAVNLWNNRITSKGATLLFDTFRIMQLTFNVLYLTYNLAIGDECMKSLGEYIKSNGSITEIWICHTSISDAGIKMLVPYLDGNATFKRLNVAGNSGITDESIVSFLKMIELSHLEDIGIDNTHIKLRSTIFTSLAQNAIKYGFNSLNFSYKLLNDEDILKICEDMKKHGIHTLKEINFQSNKITSKGASVLFNTLKECKSTLSKLNLGENHVDDECMKELGEYMKDNEYLEQLNLQYTNITDIGVDMLSEYLLGNIALKDLSFFGSRSVTDVSVPYFLDIAKKTTVTNIALEYSSISNEKQKEIQEVLKISIEKREIPIKSNTKSAAKTSASA